MKGALKTVKLGWKSYYKYARPIYLDVLGLLVNSASKYVAMETVMAMIARKKKGERRWISLARGLVKSWIHEVS